MHAHAFVYEFNTGRSAKANSIQRVIKEHVQSQMDPWVNEPDGLNGARMASVLRATVTELSLAAPRLKLRHLPYNPSPAKPEPCSALALRLVGPMGPMGPMRARWGHGAHWVHSAPCPHNQNDNSMYHVGPRTPLA